MNIPVLSAASERMALMLLGKICGDTLARYPESYEHDVERLKSSGLSYNERNCLLFRASEKKVTLPSEPR